MPIPVSIPRLGWNMEEGTFVEWVKADGDAVKPGDVVFRLEGEKATEDVESLDAGTLRLPPNAPRPGDRVAVGAVIGFLLQPGETPGVAPQASSPSPLEGEGSDGRASAVAGEGSFTTQSPHPVRSVEQNEPPSPSRGEGRSGLAQVAAVSPRARRLAKRLGVDAATLNGTGRNGRVRERDVAATAKPQEVGVPLTPVRRVVAARMVESCRTTAPVTLTSVVDATNLVNLRGQFKAAGEGAAVPSYTDFLVKLAAVALDRHPLLASRWTDAGIVPAVSIDIGVAVDTAAGLLVPVVRDVPSLGLRQLAARTGELIGLARSGTLSAADMRGGCFTITNLGAFGIDAFTPIINPPECAVLGIGRIERRPVMDGERVVGRDLLTLSLTFDHRITDGAPAARFLQTLAKCIENPAPWVSS